MKTAVLETIQYINQQLANKPQNTPLTQTSRIICLDRGNSELTRFHCTDPAPTMYKGQPCGTDEKQSWLAHIIRALIKKEVLFDVISYTPGNFLVQA